MDESDDGILDGSPGRSEADRKKSTPAVFEDDSDGFSEGSLLNYAQSKLSKIENITGDLNEVTGNSTDRDFNERYGRLLAYEINEFFSPGSHLRSLRSVQEDVHKRSVNEPSEFDSASQRGSYSYGDGLFKPSTIAGTLWTGEEKRIFFEFLGRRSRHDPLGIARSMGTKSVVECAWYISELENALSRVKMKEQRRKSRGMRSRWKRVMKRIPSAREMSPRWIKFEELESRRLEKFAQTCDRLRDATEWRRLHPRGREDDFREENQTAGRSTSYAEENEVRRVAGLIDSYCLNLLNRVTMESPDEEVLTHMLGRFGDEFQFLNIEKMMELSLRLYYSQTDLPKAVAKHIVKHSMQSSTVRLFHRLVLRFTRRLVAAVLVVAETRLRLSQETVFHRTHVIHQHDVETGCELIGATASSNKFWTDFKRRNMSVPIGGQGS